MKQLLFAFMLLASLQSNGQRYDTTIWGSFYYRDTTKKYQLIFSEPISKKLILTSAYKTSTYMPANSDTLYIMDSVIVLYDLKIRYIKIGDKVYPLKTKN